MHGTGKAKRREAAAEEFLASASGPATPERLRLCGFQRVMARAKEPEAFRGRDAWRLSTPSLYRPLYRSAAVILLVVTLLFGSTAALYAASSGSLPDSWLYGLKRAFERARVAVAFSPSSRLDLEVRYGQRRLEEIREMARSGRVRGGERWLAEYERFLASAEGRLDALQEEERDAWRSRLALLLQEHEVTLREVMGYAPAGLVPLVERARGRCAESCARMRGGPGESPDRGGGPPGDRGPGGEGDHGPGGEGEGPVQQGWDDGSCPSLGSGGAAGEEETGGQSREGGEGLGEPQGPGGGGEAGPCGPGGWQEMTGKR